MNIRLLQGVERPVGRWRLLHTQPSSCHVFVKKLANVNHLHRLHRHCQQFHVFRRCFMQSIATSFFSDDQINVPPAKRAFFHPYNQDNSQNEYSFDEMQIDRSESVGKLNTTDLHDEDKLSISLHPQLSCYGVFSEQVDIDITRLVQNYTAPALAKALRDREDILQICAQLAENDNYESLKKTLSPFLKKNIDKRRRKKVHNFDVSKGFTHETLSVFQRNLHRMPRQVFHAIGKRASVVIPLCNANGVASILFEKRSSHVRTHKGEVCFPGGMVDEELDGNVLQTSLREMHEEIGVPPESIEVLGILRCNWSEVVNITGVAVTPVIGYLGDIQMSSLNPNRDEVERCFTISIESLLNEEDWVQKEFSAPIYKGGPDVIWGLTGYILHKFLKDIVSQCNIIKKG